MEVQIDKYYSLTKMVDFKNYLQEFLKLQILRKQDIEEFQKQSQEDFQ